MHCSHRNGERIKQKNVLLKAYEQSLKKKLFTKPSLDKKNNKSSIHFFYVICWCCVAALLLQLLSTFKVIRLLNSRLSQQNDDIHYLSLALYHLLVRSHSFNREIAHLQASNANLTTQMFVALCMFVFFFLLSFHSMQLRYLYKTHTKLHRLNSATTRPSK